MVKDIRKMTRREKDLLILDLQATKRGELVEMERIKRRTRELAAEIAKLNDEIEKKRQRISDIEQSVSYLSD